MMAKNTKKVLAGVFALSCAFILAGCDNAESLPQNYKDPVVARTDGSSIDVYKNEMGVIYDAISSGKNDKVLSQFLYEMGVDQFGNYYDDATKNQEGIETIYHKGDEAIKNFLEKHKKAFNYEIDDKIASSTYTTEQMRIDRFKDFYEYTQKQIKETFYNEIKGGAYNDDNSVYQEQRLAYAHFGEMYEIENVVEQKTPWYSGYITKDLTKDNVENFVHISYGENFYKDYIERKIIPTIYKEKMVEEYILNNNYQVLGRAYGRKVNVLKITHDSKNIDIADKLMQTFVDDYILNTTSTTYFGDMAEIVADAWRGFAGIHYNSENGKTTINELSAEAKALQAKVLPATSFVTLNTPIGTVEYYKETQFGALMEEYRLATEAEGNRFATAEQSSALSKFTSSGSYPKEKGLIKELVSLSSSDYTTDGWFVKNGGLSDLPSTVRDRLFNINVSNEVDNFVDMETKDQHNYDPKDYVRYINKSYYLTPAKSQQAIANPRNFVIHDDSTSSFYIVEIDEAPSSAKLNRENEYGYIGDPNAHILKSERYAREILRVLGTKDSYTNSAYASYVEMYNVVYHDTSVYDYFKSQYPDLFED